MVDLGDLVVGSSEADVEPFDFTGHLFADPDLADFDKAAADLMTRRVLQFLDRL